MTQRIPLQFRLMAAAARNGSKLVPLSDDEPASGIEAATADKTTKIGLAEGESPVPKADAQNTAQPLSGNTPNPSNNGERHG